MIKKIFLICLFLLITPIVGAQSYPEKINGGQNFNDFNQLKDIYLHIYEDINNEDLVEVCQRTFQWPVFWNKGKTIFSIKNCQNLKNKNTLSDFLHLEKNTQTEFNDFWSKFKTRFNFERELLRQENDLSRKNSFSQIFLDGMPNGEQNSPFDIINELDEIDNIIFGEKSEKPEFEFAKNEDKENQELPETDEDKDKWLAQTEENLELDNPKFREKNSLSGIFYHGSESLKEATKNPLWLMEASKVIFGPFAKEGSFTGSRMTASTQTVPAKSSDKPESRAIILDPLRKLNALFIKYSLEESNYKTSRTEDKSSTTERLEIVNKDQILREKKIKESLKEFEVKNKQESAKMNHLVILNGFEVLRQNFNSMLENMENINTYHFTDFFKKPIYNS